MVYNEQITLEDVSDEYKQFVDKFKPKKTTDDCYTPANVFNAILEWGSEEYGFDAQKIVRPFFPGGDYERFDYPADCIVFDNPPFSILAEIVRFYDSHGVKYFLFAPSLTCFGKGKSCAIVANASIIYENGATVQTSFLTNLDTEHVCRSAPTLHKMIEAENKKNIRKIKKELPKYEYPFEIVTSAMIQKYSRYGVEYAVRREDALFYRALDSQREKSKSIFGGGYLLSERAAAERAAAEQWAAEQWALSEREIQMSKALGKNKKC